MLATYVLRLLPERLAAGVVVGEVEDVDTGTRLVIRGLDELIAFLCSASPATTTITLSDEEPSA